jgi:anti-sigma factor RsiW
MIAVIVAAYSGGWTLRGWQAAGDTGVAREAAIVHALYSGTPSAPVDASDGPRVAEAFTRALGMSPVLPEMTDLGYRLRTVQLLPAIDSTALQMIYAGGDRPITVYPRKKPGASVTPLEFSAYGKITTASWDLENITCAISGTVDREVLEAFARRLYEALDKS